jgi:hypothetical protein
MVIQRHCKALLSLTLLLMLLVVGFAGTSRLRAESPKPTRFQGTPVAITPPQQSTGPVYLHLRLRMDDGVCKVSRGTGDGGYHELFTMGEGTWSQKLSPGEAIQLDPQGHGGEYSVRFEPINLATGLRNGPASGFGMIAVAVGAVIAWRRISHAGLRWFWVGAGLWTVAVAVKVVCALLTNGAVIGFLKSHLPYPLLVACGGLFLGIQSSLCEMGFTLLAVWLWRQLGRGGGRAIAIGVGAGAFEAFLLGVAQSAVAVVVIAGLPGAESVGEGLDGLNLTPLLWLVGPVERVIAILCHASSRALILLGMASQRVMMIVWGFVIFTLLDGIAGAVLVSGKAGTLSPWWIELVLLPFALVSIPILRWCWKKYRIESCPSSAVSRATVGLQMRGEEGHD